jgi:hypothetical protein
VSKLKYGHFYMHRKSLDVFIEVVGEGKDKVYVNFWNLGCTGKPWLVDNQRFPLSTLDLDESAWVELTADDLMEPRHVHGLPFRHRGHA